MKKTLTRGRRLGSTHTLILTSTERLGRGTGERPGTGDLEPRVVLNLCRTAYSDRRRRVGIISTEQDAGPLRCSRSDKTKGPGEKSLGGKLSRGL